MIRRCRSSQTARACARRAAAGRDRAGGAWCHYSRMPTREAKSSLLVQTRSDRSIASHAATAPRPPASRLAKNPQPPIGKLTLPSDSDRRILVLSVSLLSRGKAPLIEALATTRLRDVEIAGVSRAAAGSSPPSALLVELTRINHFGIGRGGLI